MFNLLGKREQVVEPAPVVVEALSLEEIRQLKRSDIRYALFRCRTGNPEDSHKAIFGFYEPRLTKYHLDMLDFSELWDVDKKDPTNIVSGHIVHMYHEDMKSLFNEDGTLKED